MKSRRQLVVNADDFGFTRDVNAGIIEAHRYGILTATTLMANGDAFEDAVLLARENPALDVGCHLVLVGKRSLLEPDKLLPSSVPKLMAALARNRIRIYDEFAAQVERILSTGIRPTHIDTHKHTHLAPPVLEAVARLARDFRIPWVRRPFDFPITGSAAAPWLKRFTGNRLQFLRRRFHAVLNDHYCRMTDHFAGFQLTGRFGTQELLSLVRALPEGITEFMCHPGRCGPELRSAPTRLKESRERELEALIAPDVRQALDACGVELVNYRQLQ